MLVIKGSLPMVIFIMVYVAFFAWLGQRLFTGTVEGVKTFSTYSDAVFYMFVLLTTSNYPDVMLPSYAQHRLDSVFFIFYLVIGLFLLMNLLLAIFYSSYQEKFDETMDEAEDDRSKFLIKEFKMLDEDNKGYLNKDETKKLLNIIHSLVQGWDTNREINMTEGQYDEMWPVIDGNDNGKMEISQIKDLLEVYEGWQYEKNYKDALEAIYSDDLATNSRIDFSKYSKVRKMFKCMNGAYYELAMNILGILNIVSLATRQLDTNTTSTYIITWTKVQIGVNFLFMFEMIVDWLVSGFFRAYKDQFRVWPETLCQIFNIAGTVHFVQF